MESGKHYVAATQGKRHLETLPVNHRPCSKLQNNKKRVPNNNIPQNNQQKSQNIDNPKVFPVNNMGERKVENDLSSKDDATNNNQNNNIM